MHKFWSAAISGLAVACALPLMAQTPTPLQRRPASVPPAGTPQMAAPLDINSATRDELQALEGIGEIRAEALVRGRPYRTTHDLVEKKVLSEKLFDSIKDRIVVHRVGTKPGATAVRADKPSVGN